MFKPRYYQKDAFHAFFNYAAENHGKNPLIVHPTASGKSFLQAMIVEKMLEWSSTRILLLTHQKELISQNYAEFLELTERGGLFSDVGIYSAGLKKRDTSNRVLFAGIQSVWKKAWHLGFFDLILIDEAHRIPNKNMGTYRHFLDEMFKINPKIMIGGLSATPYRMKSGLLTEGKDKIFDDICHEVSIKELIDPNHYKNRDKEQFLCPPISKNAINQVDLKNVHIRGGEYVPGEMEQAFLTGDLVWRAVQEIKQYTENRNKLLIFTSGIQHCEEVCEKLNEIGISAQFSHSKQSNELNDKILKDFRKGKFKALVNINQYTTGFNVRDIDCICILRSTQSPGLYAQIVGRLLRMHPSKKDGLVLDFGGNILRHGPIDKIEVKKNIKTGTSEVHTTPQKECPQCHDVLALAVMKCPSCGYEFPQSEKHEETASEADILSKWKKPVEYDVQEVSYLKHSKTGKPDSLRVDYYIGTFEKISEWICIEHSGFAKQKAMQWIKKRTDFMIDTIDDAIEFSKYFKIPKKIIVNENNKYPLITAYLDFITPEIKEKPKEKTTVWNNAHQCFENIYDDEEIPF